MPRNDTSDRPPPRPTGEDEEAHFMQWVWDQLTIRGQLIDVPGLRFERTTQGIRPIPTPAGSAGSAGAEIELVDCATGKVYLVRGRLKPA